MSTPEHIKRIIERLEPVDQVAMEAYLAEMEGATRALLADNRDYQARTEQTIAELDNRTITLQGVIKILEKDNQALSTANRDLTNRNALLRQRPDLPVDRIPAHDHMVRLQQERDELAVQCDSLSSRLEYGVAVVTNLIEVHMEDLSEWEEEKVREAAEWVASQQIKYNRHPDDIAVDDFSIAMKEKLARSRAKGRSGWDDPEQCTVEYLAKLLVEHIAKGDPVDVGNLAMMLHQRRAGIDSIATALAERDDQIRLDAINNLADRFAEAFRDVFIPTEEKTAIGIERLIRNHGRDNYHPDGIIKKMSKEAK